MKWELTLEELADALSKWGKQADRDYFFNGYTLNLCLMQPSDKSEPWHFGHVVNVCRAGPGQIKVLKPLIGVSTSTVSIRISKPSAEGGWSDAEEAHSTMAMETCADVFPLLLFDGDKLNPPKVMALVEPFLVNGRLCVECSVFSCD